MNWQPSRCLEAPDEFRQKYHADTSRFALIILNQPILIPRHRFDNVWHNATYRFCADGGANRLYDLLKTDDERAKYLPDCIRGDLDSLRDSVKAYYESKGVSVVRVSDQDSTDFMKCVELVRLRDPIFSHSALFHSSTGGSGSASSALQDQPQAMKGLDVVALGGTGGRFDQSMSSIHHLYILNRERRAALISNESIVVVLGPGKHEITCNLEIEGPTCGVIPVGSSEATLTLRGFQWDVENWKTSFGTQLSTSNGLIGPNLTIETTASVVWTTELRDSQEQ